MADKCAHEPCKCTVDKSGEFGRYCSATCKMKGDITELRCVCGHPACR